MSEEKTMMQCRFSVGEKVIRKKTNAYGGICLGTVVDVCGEDVEVRWDGKYSNLKKNIKGKNLLPIEEKEAYLKKIFDRNHKKLLKSLQVVYEAYQAGKDDDGWWDFDDFTKFVSKSHIVGIGISEMEKYYEAEEKRKNDDLIADNPDLHRGMILAIKLNKPPVV